jgi:glutathione S-transferase
MYVLYGGGVTRALGPQMVLEEGAIPYELKIVDELKGEHRTPEYLALILAVYERCHPRAKMPAAR